MRRAAATVAAMGLMLTAGAALGQTAAPPPSSPIADFQVSPRFWYVFESYGPPIRKANPLRFGTLNGAEFALGGAVISTRLTALPETTFILSALGGTNDPSPANNQYSIVSPAFVTTTTTYTSRVDLEFLAQTAIPQSDGAWMIGGRFERHDDTFRSVVVVPTLSAPVKYLGGSANYTLKGGITGALPLTTDARLRLFGNIAVAGGVASNDAGPNPNIGIVGPDIAIGLQYAFSPAINADMRYRTIIYYLFGTARSAEQSLPQYVIQQGPMIGINIKF